MALRTLVAALLFSGVAAAETPDAAPRQALDASVQRIQQAVVKARDERHPVKLTCAVEAEFEAINWALDARQAPQRTAAAARRVAEIEVTVNRCIDTVDHSEMLRVVMKPEPMAMNDQPLFPAPPDVWFLPPLR